MFNGKNLLSYITSFSKIITLVWLGIWIETILFTQAATIFNFGDATSIQYINENVMQIGVIICGFYFCTKTVENVAQGVEYFLSETSSKTIITKRSLVEEISVDNNEEEVTEPEAVQNVEEAE